MASQRFLIAIAARNQGAAGVPAHSFARAAPEWAGTEIGTGTHLSSSVIASALSCVLHKI